MLLFFGITSASNVSHKTPGQTEPLPAHILSELRVVYIGHLGLFKPSAVWIILQPENLLLTFHFLLSPTMPKRKTADDTADKAAEAFPPSIVEACNGTFLAFGAKIPLVPDCCLSLGCLFCHWPPASASWLCCRCCASLGRCEVFSDLKATVPVLVSSN